VGPFPTQKIPLNLKVTPDRHGVFHVVDVDEEGHAPKLLGGLPIRGAFSIDLIYHASKVKLGLGLPSIFSFQENKTAQGDAYLISDNVHGVNFDGIGLLIPEVWVGPIFVTQLSFKYLKSEDLWQGGAKVTLPGSPIAINACAATPGLRLRAEEGALRSRWLRSRVPASGPARPAPPVPQRAAVAHRRGGRPQPAAPHRYDRAQLGRCRRRGRRLVRRLRDAEHAI
jgi:hypothetical protein